MRTKESTRAPVSEVIYFHVSCEGESMESTPKPLTSDPKANHLGGSKGVGKRS